MYQHSKAHMNFLKFRFKVNFKSSKIHFVVQREITGIILLPLVCKLLHNRIKHLFHATYQYS